MGKLYYSRAPSLVINPESQTAPKLGSIFATLDTLLAPLNQSNCLNPPESLLNSSSSTDLQDTDGKKLQVTAGLQATAAYGIGGSGGLIYDFSHDKENVYSCEQLDTDEFSPTLEFVTKSIQASPEVQNYIDNAFVGRKRVYMVTGLKIATGFSTSSTRTTEHNPQLQVGGDGTPVGVPIQVGPSLGFRVAKSRALSQGRTTNKIIFAYRVIRVKKKWDGQFRFKTKSGGKYSLDDDSSDADSDELELELMDDDNIATDFPGAVKISPVSETGV